MAKKEWGDLNPGYGERERLTDRVVIADKKGYTNKYRDFRFLPGGVTSYVEIWFPIYRDGKHLIGKDGKPVSVPKVVTNYDSMTEKHTDKVCPYLELAEKLNTVIKEDRYKVKPRRLYLAEAIDRVLQEAKPRNTPKFSKKELQTGYKQMDSASWTPVVVQAMPGSLTRKVQGITQLNNVRDNKTGVKKTYPISHPKFGTDVSIKFNPEEKGGAMYDASKGERSPLTEDELKYLRWDLDSAIIVEKPEEAQKEADNIFKGFAPLFKKSKKKSSDDDDDDDDDDLPDDMEDDEDYVSSKKKKNKKKSSKDDDDDVPWKDDDDDDEDEDDEPKSKKKSKKKSSDDDDDDDDEPKSKKKSSKKRSSDDDDEDEDEDDEPKKKSSKKKRRPMEDSSDDDDDDDEDDDEPKSKKKSKKRSSDDEDDDDDEPKSKKKSSKKKSSDDDDDDLDDLDGIDDLDDEDDEDEPKRKKKSSKKRR